jgi:hypothetical protein
LAQWTDGVVALLPFLLVLVLALAVAAGVAFVRREPPSRETTVAAARRHAAGTSALGLALGLTAAVASVGIGLRTLSGAGSLGLAALSAPLAFGIAHTVVLLLGELTWPRPAGEIRRARLVRRGPWDAAPRWLRRVAAAASLTAVLTVVLGGLAADPDGRSVSAGPASELVASASPFPGWTYGGPAAAGLLLLGAITLAALTAVANRPAVVTDDDRAEDALRRASAHRVLRGATTAALVTTGGLLLTGGHAVWRVGAAAGPGLLAATGVLAASAGLIAVLGGLVVAVVRAPGAPVGDAAVRTG